MAKPKAAAKSAKSPNSVPPVTGVRIPDDLRDDLDAIVEEQNARNAAEGLTTNRNALIVRLLREGVARMKSAKSDGGPQS